MFDIWAQILIRPWIFLLAQSLIGIACVIVIVETKHKPIRWLVASSLASGIIGWNVYWFSWGIFLFAFDIEAACFDHGGPMRRTSVADYGYGLFPLSNKCSNGFDVVPLEVNIAWRLIQKPVLFVLGIVFRGWFGRCRARYGVGVGNRCGGRAMF